MNSQHLIRLIIIMFYRVEQKGALRCYFKDNFSGAVMYTGCYMIRSQVKFSVELNQYRKQNFLNCFQYSGSVVVLVSLILLILGISSLGPKFNFRVLCSAADYGLTLLRLEDSPLCSAVGRKIMMQRPKPSPPRISLPNNVLIMCCTKTEIYKVSFLLLN